ncbi:hypothetical protein TNCV_3641181 [Trichonephila clavipes]|nr:hypothetical protein TNCV_3641181 [Trichonephila clavipes]
MTPITMLHLALHQLSARQSTPNKAVILSNSSSTIQALDKRAWTKVSKTKVPESRIAGSCYADFHQRLSSSGCLLIVAFGEIKWRTF